MIFCADIPGERLDAFVARVCPELSRSAAQRLIEEGCVTLNGKAPKKNDRLQEGDKVSFEIPEPKEVDIAPRDIPLEIVYEDDDVIVLNKPKRNYHQV